MTTRSCRSRRSRAAVLAVPALMLGGLFASSAAAPATAAAPAGSPVAAVTAAPESGPPPKMELVLDLSGSMKENDAGGQTRLAAAKQAVTRIIDTAPEQVQLGLRVYGAQYPGQDKTQGCKDTQQVLPVTGMNAASRGNARQQIAGFNAVGFTPIGVSLREAAKDLGTQGPRRVVLVSDGEDTCAPPPPCDVAKELKAQGVELAVDAIGFKTTGAARDQLKCIANVTGGIYADAADADALTANLGTVFRKAWTTYQATGKPVTGSTTGCANAPVLTPGQYLDTAVTGAKQYYKVVKRPDQLLQVGATVALTPSIQHSNIEIVAGAYTPTGDPSGWMRGFAQSTGWANVLSAGARSKAPEAGAKQNSAPGDEGCVMIENHVTDPTVKKFPMELLIGLADADPAKSAGRTPAPPAPRTGLDAAGGMSFNSATPIGAGTVRQSIAIGEWPIWRVDLKAGQKLTVKGGAEVPADLPYSPNSGFGVTVFNPLRDAASCSPSDGSIALIGSKYGRVEKTCGPWEVAKPGDPATETAGFTRPGTYYLAVGLGSLPKEALGMVVPIDLTVSIEGTPRPAAEPLFDFGTESAATQPAAGTDPSGRPGQSPAPGGTDLSGESTAAKKDDESAVSKLALPVGIGAAVLILGGVGFYGLRRR